VLFFATKYFHNKLVYYEKLCQHVTLQNATSNDANVASAPDIHTAIIFVLLKDSCTYELSKYSDSWHDVHRAFRLNSSKSIARKQGRQCA